MNFSLRIMCPSILLAFCVPVLAKCPMGTVKVHGRVENLPTNTVSAEVTVTLQTPKGPKSETVPVLNGEFSEEIQFGTQSASYFPLWGDRCNSVPKSVDIKVMVGTRIVGEIGLTFKDDFEPESPNVYRLKRELTIRSQNRTQRTLQFEPGWGRSARGLESRIACSQRVQAGDERIRLHLSIDESRRSAGPDWRPPSSAPTARSSGHPTEGHAATSPSGGWPGL